LDCPFRTSVKSATDARGKIVGQSQRIFTTHALGKEDTACRKILDSSIDARFRHRPE
jgi:hypothetical protein